MASLKKFFLLALACLSLLLSGCGSQAQSHPSSQALTIGVTPGPQAEIMTFVQGLARQEGLELELVEYKDYVQPNLDVHLGKLWGNSLQHAPYLASTLAKEPKFQLVAAFNTISYPLALYPGQRHELLEQLKLQALAQQELVAQKATLKEELTPQEQLAADLAQAQLQDKLLIGLPSDPTNLSRSLQLLAAARYLELKEPAKELYTLADIVLPNHQIQLLPMDAALLPKMLEELDLAVISCDYALVNGLRPAQDAVFMETANNPYVNVFVARADQQDDLRLQQLARLYRSKETKKFIFERYQGGILPSW